MLPLPIELNRMCRLIDVLLLALPLATVVSAQKEPVPELTPEEISLAEQDLKIALVGPGEEAFLQIFIKASIVPDPTIDTSFVYDLILRFDPDRYASPRVGIYPLNFEDQFILWGKRIAVYTRSTSWQSGRFYLQDISSGQQAWIYTDDARRLYIPARPPPDQRGKPSNIFAVDENYSRHKTRHGPTHHEPLAPANALPVPHSGPQAKQQIKDGDALLNLFYLLCGLLCWNCAPQPQDVLVFGRGSDSVGLDPALENDGESFKVCDNIYETLVSYQEESTAIQPRYGQNLWMSLERIQVN